MRRHIVPLPVFACLLACSPEGPELLKDIAEAGHFSQQVSEGHIEVDTLQCPSSAHAVAESYEKHCRALEFGGGSGIRTHDTIHHRIRAFQARAFSRSAIPPLRRPEVRDPLGRGPGGRGAGR